MRGLSEFQLPFPGTIGVDPKGFMFKYIEVQRSRVS